MAKARPTNQQELKASFDAEHAKGMRALKTHDFSAVTRAIERERELIEQHKRRISEQRSKYAKRKKT